jgi:DedD protein
MSDPSDANLQLKKRARRRLVGAIAFAGLAAVVLPMVMDEEPKQQVQDVQISIPGQDKTPFTPKLVKPPAAPVAGEKAMTPQKAEPADQSPPVAEVVKPAEMPPASKTAEKVPEKPPEKPVRTGGSEPRRAAAILGGKTAEAASAAPTAPASNAGGQYVILIGAFSNPANVKQLQGKIGELGIKVYTEPLVSPEGKKTRVRAGPFTSREAADKALDKLKRIGVNGVVTARQ